MKGKVTGLGGVFIKCKDPKAMRNFYEECLGMTTNDYGVGFEFVRDEGGSGFIQLGTFEEDSTYFGEPKQKAMLNFRVDNLEGLIEGLEEKGIKIVNELEDFEYGKFIHILDVDGNRIELWEPKDAFFAGDGSPKQKMN